MKASVDCVTGNNQPCNRTRVNAANCTTLTATYFYTYCNLNSDPGTGKINLNNKTFGTINDRIINATDFSILPTQTCRTFQETATVNTCNNFFSASMKTEGTIANVARYQYCFDYNFIKYKPLINFTDPEYNYTKQWCDVTASIGCRQTSNNALCNNLVASTTSCGLTNVTYNFTMCNRLSSFNVRLNPKTYYAISGEITRVNLTAIPTLQGGGCRTILRTVSVNTCNDILPSQLKVEGTIANSRFTYCYAFRFFKFSPLAPTGKPSSVVLE